MNTDTAHSWRDLLDSLTDKQISHLAASTHMSEPDLLEVAQDYAEQNRIQTDYAHIPAPAGATHTFPWSDDFGDGVSRGFYGAEWPVGEVAARIVGEQSTDGSTTQTIEVRHRERTNGELTANEARKLGLALIAAAEELDRLNGDAPPF